MYSKIYLCISIPKPCTNKLFIFVPRTNNLKIKDIRLFFVHYFYFFVNFFEFFVLKNFIIITSLNEYFDRIEIKLKFN